MLTNNQIKSLIQSHNIILDHDVSRIQPASYDMVIGTIFRNGRIISSKTGNNDPVVIEPGEVVTMLTKEHLQLPANVAATAYAMNAQSSEGLLVLNPGHVDPGYTGPLTVVALNLRKVPLALQLGDRIFTVVFEKLSEDCNPAYPAASANRDVLERAANKKVVEKSIGSLSQLLAISEKDIRGIIASHWMSRVVTGSTIFAAVFACGALIFTVRPDWVVKTPPQQVTPVSTDVAKTPEQITPLATATAQSGGARNTNVAQPMPQPIKNQKTSDAK